MYDTVLVPTDGSDTARRAADRAVDVASRYGATVRALYVIDSADLGLTTPADPHSSRLKRTLREAGDRAVAAVADAAEEAGVAVETDVVVGVPHAAILASVEETGADLVVMGTHGRTGLARAFLGSTAERVVRRSPVPVLVVPPTE
jgi:nucleotide-binding universal stress UspA family protein